MNILTPVVGPVLDMITNEHTENVGEANSRFARASTGGRPHAGETLAERVFRGRASAEELKVWRQSTCAGE